MLTFAETADKIAATTKKLQKTALLAEYLKSVPVEEAAIAAVFFSGRPFPANPFGAVLAPRVPRRLPRCPSSDDVRTLLDQTRNPRHKALLTLLARCGLRASEARGLDIRDVLRGQRRHAHVRRAEDGP